MKKVLVVEDNERNMYLISFILEKMGHRVLQADSGEKGIELASREQPDLVLMDIQLPGIDGLEAAKRIRQSGDVPIIAITSFAMTGDRERLLAAGYKGYIEKPINTETIMGEIAAYLEKSEEKQ